MLAIPQPRGLLYAAGLQPRPCHLFLLLLCRVLWWLAFALVLVGWAGVDVRAPRGGAQLLVDTSRLPYLDGGLDDDEAAKDVWPRQFPLLLPGASSWRKWRGGGGGTWRGRYKAPQ